VLVEERDRAIPGKLRRRLVVARRRVVVESVALKASHIALMRGSFSAMWMSSGARILDTWSKAGAAP
jgi:hypothetical protein